VEKSLVSLGEADRLDEALNDKRDMDFRRMRTILQYFHERERRTKFGEMRSSPLSPSDGDTCEAGVGRKKRKLQAAAGQDKRRRRADARVM
jgi:hypothetical protein